MLYCTVAPMALPKTVNAIPSVKKPQKLDFRLCSFKPKELLGRKREGQ